MTDTFLQGESDEVGLLFGSYFIILLVMESRLVDQRWKKDKEVKNNNVIREQQRHKGWSHMEDRTFVSLEKNKVGNPSFGT